MWTARHRLKPCRSLGQTDRIFTPTREPTLRRLALSLVLLLSAAPAFGQGGILRGRILAADSHEPVSFANVTLQGSGTGTLSSEDGTFEFKGLEPGLYNLQVAQLGYRKVALPELEVTRTRPTVIEVLLEPDVLASDSIAVTASPFARRDESPVSLRTIGAAEIERAPGGNRDISKVLQNQPGVAGTANFRNDIIIRGGAPSENRFFLDGIEVPNINHFATQGSSGGPVGMIDVDLVQQVELYTSAFPVNRGGALSSVIDFQLKDGNDSRVATAGTIGASDAGLAIDGPLGKRSTFLLSARRSYLQFLFSALGLPFLPTYNDAQFKVRTRAGERNEFELVGLGAIDRFKLNTSAKDTELNRYLLDLLPVTPQWNFTLGGSWKRFGQNGYSQVTLSHSELDNRSTKFKNNDATDPAGLIQDYHSSEVENRLRAERTMRRGGWKMTVGAGIEQGNYSNDSFQKRAIASGLFVDRFNSRLAVTRYNAFTQASRSLAGDRLTISAGSRADGADYSGLTRNPLDQWSPRIALSLAVSPRWRLNANAGRYHQLPAYTVLGYRDTLGVLVNRDAGVRWIRADHLVAGAEFTDARNARLSLEGFFKRYANYPFLTLDGVSLANLGADFGAIGNSPANATSRGRSYGLELLAQQKLYRGFYGIAAYTFVRSEFTDARGNFAPSAWDNRHVATLTGGRRFSRGWETGVHWRLLGGAPFTPDNVALSSLREVWDAVGRGVPDYTRLNTRRTGVLHQLDIRVDKTWLLRGSQLTAYLDVQNVYAQLPKAAPILAVQRDASGLPLTDPQDPTRYLTQVIADDPGTALPTIGLRLRF